MILKNCRVEIHPDLGMDVIHVCISGTDSNGTTKHWTIGKMHNADLLHGKVHDIFLSNPDILIGVPEEEE